MRTETSHLGQVMRFSLAGAAGVSLYYAALFCLTEYLGVWYVISAVIGFVLNTGLNFILQKFWTFQSKEVHMVGRQLLQYIAMSVSFFFGNILLLYLMVEYLRLWYIGAQVILTIVISVFGFIISRKIFKHEVGTEN